MRTGACFDHEQVMLIGDTPNDVRVGLPAGVRVIDVAPGKTSEAELLHARATRAAPTLSEFRLASPPRPEVRPH
ncbi:HAD hydrolase-like protein [Amycolatopsis sp. DG1A-15b]|uniref:HAD hydrolase-like protein n=1 Tax=Amycolatopsis sp. DG1A-15b TaxID=3052846 RepID=UPI00255C0D2E|nr:HAD hydrolase-like protein [Amycolatopsis sp. DG1A-15b]WIX92574.1 HAD hydrolase-like protein [Amycolatopsis sp. DG1A-15b]